MKVCIIVPVYNAEKYIADCFRSIANQTYKNIEAVFVDDCSTDNSYNTLLELKEGQKDGEIQYKIIKHEKNGGVHISRNTGISEALNSGADYMAFMDNDDVITPNCIERLLSFTKKYPNAEIIQGAHFTLGEDNWLLPPNISDQTWNGVWDIIYDKIIKSSIKKDFEEVLNGVEIIKFWLYYMRVYELIALFGVWAALYKTDFIKKNDIRFSEDLPVTEDVWFRYLCFKNAAQIVIDHYPVYFYRARNNSYSAAAQEQYQRKYCWAVCLEKMLLDADNKEYSQLLLRWLFEWARFWAGELKTEKEKALLTRYLDILKRIGEKNRPE